MHKLRRSLYRTGVLIIAAFLLLSSWFGYTVYSQGSEWTGSKYNTRKSTAAATALRGSITDRYGVILADNDADGGRRYNPDELLRRSVSQTVGDVMSMSGTGVESCHSDILTGYSGSVADRILAAISGNSYTGDNIRLTVDANLCRYIANAFPEGYEGAVVVLNYRTGEILAMVSQPDYDPQALLDGIVEQSDGSYYFNRCLQGQYTPGSVFKMVTLTAALEHRPELVNAVYSCTGTRKFGNTQVTCQSGRVKHGSMSLQGAFTKSCNCSFASITQAIGADALRETAARFGMNENWSFPDVMLYSSSMAEDLSDTGDLGWTGVGQGETTVTPLHMAMIAGSFANQGVMMEPKLIAGVTGASGTVKRTLESEGWRAVTDENTARTVTKYMYRTVQEGTAKNAAVEGFRVCGKTGSAETTADKNVATNAWFAGFLAEEDYPYAIAVVIEEGGAGSDRACTLASQVLTRAIRLTDARKAQGK